MKKEISSKGLERFLSVEIKHEVAIVRLTDDILDVAFELGTSQQLRDLFESLSATSGIGAILFISTESCFSSERADKFWKYYQSKTIL